MLYNASSAESLFSRLAKIFWMQSLVGMTFDVDTLSLGSIWMRAQEQAATGSNAVSVHG